ncbi:unnamed protein product [Brassica rapa]|uniref:Uncharacterized protein n=2 Tax=Brassica TaxID=3705 RepID=A0A8D9GR74_BRACM|nr:unnamed protein product [Brassica napus]CAG7885511.1 unnamed protein product [Brassica rapa]
MIGFEVKFSILKCHKAVWELQEEELRSVGCAEGYGVKSGQSTASENFVAVLIIFGMFGISRPPESECSHIGFAHDPIQKEVKERLLTDKDGGSRAFGGDRTKRPITLRVSSILDEKALQDDD